MFKKSLSFLVLLLLAFFVFFKISPICAAEISQEAKRHMARGTAAMKYAKSAADYQDAVREFKKAIEYAPDWSDAWFNLGVAQESAGDFAGSIKSFRTYLEKNPKAADRDKVETRIYELEYRQEKQTKQKQAKVQPTEKTLAEKLNGKWCLERFGKLECDCELTVSGNKVEMFRSNGRYLVVRGTIQGNKITGTTISYFSELDPNCPPIKVPVRGTISTDGRKIAFSTEQPVKFWDSTASEPSKRCTCEGKKIEEDVYVRKDW